MEVHFNTQRKATMLRQMLIDLFTGGPPDPFYPERTVVDPLWIAEQSQINSCLMDNSQFSASTIDPPSYFDFNSNDTFHTGF